MGEFVLVSENFWGNIHDTCDAINRRGLAQYVVSMHSVSGNASIAVFRVTKQQASTLFNR